MLRFDSTLLVGVVGRALRQKEREGDGVMLKSDWGEEREVRRSARRSCKDEVG